jgi:hypothetical protein
VIAVSTLHETITGQSGRLTLPAKMRQTAGTYTITLTVRDAAGNVSSAHLTYRVAVRRRASLKKASAASNPPAFAAPDAAALRVLSEVAWAHGLSVSVRSHDADLVRDGGQIPAASCLREARAGRGLSIRYL